MGGQKEAFKSPALPTGEQCCVRAKLCLPACPLSGSSPELQSPLEPQQIPLSELTTKNPEQVMA